jgi:hypothetical protein
MSMLEDSPSRSKRRWIYVAGALALLAAGRLFGSGNSATPPPSVPSSLDGSLASSSAATNATAAGPLRHPPSALVELGILTDKSENEIDPILERPALAGLIVPADCGDDAACNAVRAAIQEEHTTTLLIVPASNWNISQSDIDSSASSLSEPVRATIKKRARIVVVHVATATSSRQLAVRAAYAAAAVIAEKADGLVYDQLLARIEGPREFAAHLVTEPLDRSAFRKDRVELLYEPKAAGVVRILTSGLSRWGAPDVEAAAVPVAASGRVADIVLAVAEALANGAVGGPLPLSRDDLARARGAPYPTESDVPASAPIVIDLTSVHPEGGDPNDFMARIEPPGGSGPLGYLDLAERFFGSLASPDDTALRANRERTQRALPSALTRWAASRSAGATLLVQLPFEIAGEGGIESMWIDVTRVDAHTVTGRLVDDPLGATQFNRGDEITRPLTAIEDLEIRERRDP